MKMKVDFCLYLKSFMFDNLFYEWTICKNLIELGWLMHEKIMNELLFDAILIGFGWD